MSFPDLLMSALKVKPQNREKFWRETKSLTKFIIGFLVFSSLFFKPFNIPTGSMIPNLLVGDFLVVNKFAYGYTRHSLPFGSDINWFEGRIMPENPKMGDIGVFNNPNDPEPFSILGFKLWNSSKDYVKRIVGLPGDRIQMKRGRLWINGVECPIQRIEDFPLLTRSGKTVMVPQFVETLPNGVKHTFIKQVQFGEIRPFRHDSEHSSDDTIEYVVPEEHFMIVGDNRDDSLDSRFMDDRVKFIPFNNLMGKVSFVFFSTSAKWYEFWKWPTGIRFERTMIFPK
jgi:signal peptidase I